MTAFSRITRCSSILLALGSLLAWSVALATKPQPAEVVDSATLGGKDRYLAHVSTDKPIYRAGEKVYVRSVVLHAADRTPLKDSIAGFVEIKGPKGNTVSSGHATTEESVTGFAWEVPEGQAGGEYTARVTYPALGLPPAERNFDVRAYRAPRIKTQITFFRDGYGPGDQVGATLEATRAEGGAPAGASVTVTARVDGKEIHRASATLDRDGNATARFALPQKITRGDGTLVFAIADGGVTETATKTIPILLQTVDLAAFPEGGDLVAELPCRVYVETRTPSQKPADVAGVVLTADKRQVGTFRTEHEGRGRFVFTPRKGERYHLAITEPAGITTTFDLPAVRESGTLIQSTTDVYAAREAVTLRVLSTDAGPLTVTLRKREVELASLTVRGSRQQGQPVTADVTLTAPASADGVLVATVWNGDGVPLAERLVYRQPTHHVTVKIEPDHDRYTPAGKVNLTLTATDENGQPVEAVVGVTVTDDSVLEMIETREQAPRLPVMVLLEPEVRELADAQVYLDRDNPEAPLALDLLLGTQGWRRFAFMRTTDFIAQHGDAARRALALRIVTRHMAVKSGARRGGRWFGMVADGMDVQAAAVPRPMGAMPPAVAPPAEKPVIVGNEEDKDRDEKLGEREVGGKRDELRQDLAKVVEKEEQVRRKRRLFADDAEMEMMSELRATVYISVREYAHTVRPNRQPNDRVDFAETLFWHAGIKTGKDGKATLAFALSDAVTSFRISADAFTRKGALGSGSTLVDSVQPFYLEPKLPLEVTMGDVIELPIAFVNGTAETLNDVTFTLTAAKGIAIGAVAPFSLAADSRVRQVVRLTVGELTGEGEVVIAATAGPYSDTVTRTLRVVPRGFPVEIGEGGMLEPDSTLSFTIDIPKTRVPGSVKSALAICPTPLANLTEALQRLMREPNGCFEQTSSTTYPLVMAQQYFLSHQGVDPKLVERSRALLEKGYKRLIGYECKKRGYEWFGGDPGHEALTAYGLLEFTDMAEVHNVDAGMLKRTRAWLMKAKDGKGGFKRERRALHTWIADPDCSNAYIVWALLTAGEPASALADEIETVKQAALKSKNSYVIALGANVAWLAGDASTAKTLCRTLATHQVKDGGVEGGITTIVGSGGTSLQVETTALAVLAWLQDPDQAGAVEKGIQWLAEICKGGRYGSTQSTVLALRAILAYDAARSTPKAPGSVELMVDGRQAGSAVAFNKDTQGAIELTDIAELLEPGKHVIEIRMVGGSAMPCSVTVDYANEKPDSSDACKVGIAVALVSGTVEEGGVTEATVTVTNRAEDEIIPTPIAIVGIPGGLEVRHDQLKELVKAGRIAAYEVRGREVVLYWRELKAEQKVELPLSLVAAIPGSYTAPASRAYLYYTDEHKSWAAPVAAVVGAGQ
ncbi:MAG: A-macroglobulin complement component [Verrucomicrobia bacterium]|jgi:alpha-2-macroglobulin-like protein|nr:A-macroglobulin complement component [Verrucomicrobiota bacterium]MBT7066891.1 A-macroglobulin complement component [Verrucomicrobiota bacterium]MBT7699822.1 A-macroglobulin complement component [Verrucomicrobiota bacterium]